MASSQRLSDDYKALKMKYDKLSKSYDQDLNRLEAQRLRDINERDAIIQNLQKQMDSSTLDSKEDLLLEEIDNLKYDLSVANTQLSGKVRMLTKLEDELSNLTKKFEETSMFLILYNI